ncbi:MAG TPA: MmgE/PrpD family protein [Geminicoccaceae bacterium]|nr:MmgE/PrpD family protein [Geminicoccaceae bacterium]
MAVAPEADLPDAVSPVTRELSDYVAAALARPLPEEVTEKAKCHLLDTLAAMVSGSRLPPGERAIAYVRAQGGRRQATVVGSRCVTTAVNAALANGMSAHADESDDSHAGGRFHPGCAVVPAALAAAELADRDGACLLRALALGYDIGARFVIALGLDGAYVRPHSTHSLGGLFGAAAAAGALLGLDARQARFQLSYTVQQASGLAYWMRDPDHIEKAFDFGGMPARNGVAAATMAAAGFTGVEDPLAGAHTFFEAFGEATRPAALVEGLGSRFEIMQASIKKWPAGAPIQAALDALETLMRAHGLGAQDVAGLTVRLPDDRIHLVDDRGIPNLCAQHLLAVLLLDGELGFNAAHGKARMRDPAVLALRRHIRLIPDAALTRALPPRQAIVELDTRDDRRLAHHTRAVRGTPDDPMERHEVEAKAEDLLAPVLGPERARALVAQVRQIERQTSVRALRPLLQA